MRKRHGGSQRRGARALAILPLLLTGCAGAGASSNVCLLLPLREYDPAFTKRFLGELEAAPPGAAWPVFASDSVALRDAVRACRGN